MPLSMCSKEVEVTVKKVGGSTDVRQHLSEIGFNKGSKVSVVAELNGSIIVRVKDARIALDKAMANKILV